ncbi:MAG: glycosyltransferase 87 family protein, partial [Acidobacteria bacterium]|nr:glycosyltransferase 87 family protein [Acidobacteriota bacterium]
ALAAALLTGTVLLWRRHELAAGLLLGLLAFKPQYALPLLDLAVLRVQRSIYLGSAMTLSALALSSGLAFGFGRWLEFFRVVGQTNPTVPFMVNWMGLAWRVSPGNPMIEQLAIPVYLSVIALFLGGVWKFRNHSSVESQLSLAVALTLVASPNTHPYDLLVLTPALFYVGGRRGGAMAGLLFFLATWLLLPGARRWALSLLLLLFAALCAARLWREVDDEGEATNVGA